MSRTTRAALIGLPLVAAAAAAVGGWFLYQREQQPPPPPDNPGGRGPDPVAAKAAAGKLVVLVVFDQMRGDYLARWAEHFGPDGFARLKTDGVWYADCHLPYACSSTGPGHASIVTGAPPSVHGIIENDWFDRAAAAHVYCVQPTRPYERVPPLATPEPPGRGSAAGFSPERLLAETVGDRLQTATGGKGRVVSLSLKDRTAVLMGGRKPTAAYCFDTRDGKFHTGAFYRDKPHPWVEEFNAEKPADGWAGKEWTPLRPDLDYNRLAGRDDAPGEGFGASKEKVFGQGRVFPHPFPSQEVRAAEPKLYHAAIESSPAGNELLLALVKKAVAAEKLGDNGAADLLCVSFSSNDLIGHTWGPDSWEALDVTLRSDRLVADFLKFLDDRLGRDRYVMAVTADHGVCPIPEQQRYPNLYPAAERVKPEAVFGPLGAALDETFGTAPAGPTRWLEVEGPDAGLLWPWVYLNNNAIKARGLEPAAVADYAAQWVGNRPFMLTAFTRKQIESNTLPPLSPGTEKEVRAAFERVKLAYHPARCGDVIGVPKPGVLVTGYGTGTNHGSPHAYDTHVPVLLYGAGVPAVGKRTEPKSSLIVAPFLARALGIDPPSGAIEKVPPETVVK